MRRICNVAQANRVRGRIYEHMINIARDKLRGNGRVRDIVNNVYSLARGRLIYRVRGRAHEIFFCAHALRNSEIRT